MKKIILAACMSAVVFSGSAKDTAELKEPAFNSNLFSGVYGGLGVGGNFWKSDGESHSSGGSSNEKVEIHSMNRPTGTVVFGGSRTFADKIYVGGEVLVDLSKSRQCTIKTQSVLAVGQSKERGIVPALALRFGYVKNDWLFYFKPSASFPKITTTDNSSGSEESVCRASFGMGLGVEKSFHEKFSVRLEGDYLLPIKKEDADSSTSYRKGFNLRALVVYGIKF